MLTALIAELPATPPKNLKKLLEVYLEVLAVKSSSPHNEALAAKLAGWKATASLTKLVAAIENRLLLPEKG